MFCYIYEYIVAPEHLTAFTRDYGADGPWVRLFSEDPAYQGTELHRDVNDPQRFLTIDRWTSRGACLSFRAHRRDEFEEIDEACERYTIVERSLGEFVRC